MMVPFSNKLIESQRESLGRSRCLARFVAVMAMLASSAVIAGGASGVPGMSGQQISVDRVPGEPLYILANVRGKKQVIVVPAGSNRASAVIDYDEWMRSSAQEIERLGGRAPVVPGNPSVDMGNLGAPRMAPFSGVIERMARKKGVDPALVRAVIHAESAYNARAISPKGAGGLMQLMPATAKRFGVTDRFDPGENIRGGVSYLKWLMDHFNDPELAVAAYNAGEGAVSRYKGVPPYKETRTYVGRVMSLWSAYRQKYGNS